MIKLSSKFIKATVFCAAMLGILAGNRVDAATPAQGDYGKTEATAGESKNGTHPKARRYPYGYQFYRHGRRHRHGPSRGYYHSKILSSQGCNATPIDRCEAVLKLRR